MLPSRMTAGHDDPEVLALRPQANGEDPLTQGDRRTLRLAVPGLSLERLDLLIAFQRKWVAALQAGRGSAESYESLAQKSGLTRKEANELEALARAFAGEVWTLRTMQARLARALAEPSPGRRDRLALEKLPQEIQAKEAGQALEKRYGPETIALLRQREDELVAIHEELHALLRR